MRNAVFWANSIKWFHAAFVLFAVFGGLLLWHWPWIAWAHLPVVIWAGGINLLGWICPLTPLENRFRAAAGQQGYSGGFIQHYMERAGVTGLDRRTLETRVGWGILALNAGLYLAALLTGGLA